MKKDMEKGKGPKGSKRRQYTREEGASEVKVEEGGVGRGTSVLNKFISRRRERSLIYIHHGGHRIRFLGLHLPNLESLKPRSPGAGSIRAYY